MRRAFWMKLKESSYLSSSKAATAALYLQKKNRI